MIRFKKKLFLLLLSVFIMLFLLGYFKLCSVFNIKIKSNHNLTNIQQNHVNSMKTVEEITIVVVICEDRVKLALVMIKSAIIFRQTANLKFIIVLEHYLKPEISIKLHRMNSSGNNTFSFELYNISFPDNKEKEWRTLFRPCASQRLFLPVVLTNMSKILYVDTDTIFLNELSDIWRHFKVMNSSQMSAVVPEHEDPNIGWYNRFARHPYYGELGVNSGVMLMNLEKMREFQWVNYLEPIFKEFKSKLIWGDQDIINIMFYYHPDKLYVYPCRYNYRTDHCMYKSICKDAEINGVSVLHGSRNTFFSDKEIAFKAIYEGFLNYDLGTDLKKYLLEPLRNSLRKTIHTNCGAVMDIYLKNLERLYGSDANR